MILIFLAHKINKSAFLLPVTGMGIMISVRAAEETYQYQTNTTVHNYSTARRKQLCNLIFSSKL